ncbi:MAG: DUF4834 family protein [Flavobacteriaceae bacterium]
MTFLKTVLILILVYLGLKMLLQLLKPYLMRFIAKKVQQRFENAFGQNPFQQYHSPKEEPITVNKNNSKKPKSKKVVGEYIDFEEVEE